MSPEALLPLIQECYRPQFRSTCDGEPSLELAARALASYLRTIVDGDSPSTGMPPGTASR